MYAHCLEAIFGANVFDGDSDHQPSVFSVTEKLCYHSIEKCLVDLCSVLSRQESQSPKRLLTDLLSSYSEKCEKIA